MSAIKENPHIKITPAQQDGHNPAQRRKDNTKRNNLLDKTFGIQRHIKTAYRLREGGKPITNLSFDVREKNQIIATIQFWNILVGNKRTPLILLGPIAVDTEKRGRGIGYQLMTHALTKAKKYGHKAVILVGDIDYYKKIGFKQIPKGQIILPGPFEPNRLLYLNLKPNAIKKVQGCALPPHRIIQDPSQNPSQKP